MGLDKILKMLDVDYSDLRSVINKKLKSFSKNEKKIIFEFLCRNPAILLRFLSGDITVEAAILLALQSEMGLDNTEIDIQVGRYSSKIEDDTDVVNAVALGGMLLIVCLLEMQNNNSCPCHNCV